MSRRPIPGRISHVLLAAAAVAAAFATPAAPALPPAPALKVPAGYAAELYARGLQRPTALAFGPDGLLYATQESGEVVVVGRGTTKPRVLARGFQTPLGLAWSGSTLYVSRGLRNPYGLAFHPDSDALYASENGRDDLGGREPAETVGASVPARCTGGPGAGRAGASAGSAARAAASRRPSPTSSRTPPRAASRSGTARSTSPSAAST